MRTTSIYRHLDALALGVPLVLAFSTPALATPQVLATTTVSANLTPVPENGSTGSATAMVSVTGNFIDLTLSAEGLSAGPHAVHIDYGLTSAHACPTTAADTNRDDRITTTETVSTTGPFVTSLTSTGDTAPKSAWAAARFASGAQFQYKRTNIPVPSDVAHAISTGQALIVIHGVQYTGSRASARSELDPSLPAAATDTALCGRLIAAPSGGAATGVGGSTHQNDPLVVLGVLSLVGAAGLALRVRSTRR